MADTCLNCMGLIMEPGTTYGYAGKICYCPVNPELRFQRPASKERIITNDDVEFIEKAQKKTK